MSLPREPRTTLDRHGVYHLAGRDPRAVADAFGYLQATAHPVGTFSALASGRGDLAAVFGPVDSRASGPALLRDPRVAWDVDVRRFRFAAHAGRLWRGLDDVHREWIEGFAAGVERARCELRRTAPAAPLSALIAKRVTPRCILALDVRIAAHHELGRMDQRRREPRASNAIAVGGPRARGGGGWLMIDPHIPLGGMPELRLLAVSVRTRGYAAAGYARLGSPLVFIGFSRYLAWTITTNWPDTLRWYALRRRGERYVEHAGDRTRHHRRLEREVTISIAGRRDARVTLAYAGRLDRPIVRSLGGGRVAAVTLATATGGEITAQLHTAAVVRTVPAFRRRVLSIAGASNTNFIVADRDGRIGCAWYGRVPSEDGGYHDATALPFERGESTGLLIQNNVTFDRVVPGGGDVDLTGVPTRIVNGPSVSSFRQARCVERLARHATIGRTELEEILADAHDRRSRVFVARMTEVLEARSPRRRRMLNALREVGRWRGDYGIANRRATLVALWLERSQRAVPAFGGWFERPEFIPDAFDARAIDAAAVALVRAFDDWITAGRPAWGDVHRFRCGAVDWPVSGASHANRNAGWATRPDVDPGTMHFPVEIGSAAAIVVHLTTSGAHARMLRTLGPLEDPAAPATRAAARAWAEARFVPLHLG